jgi:hypothetical protein
MVKAQITKIALIQMRCGPEPDKNFARAVEFIRDAAKQGAQIVCLPELFRSQYFCQMEDHKNFELAEEVPGKSTSALGDVARETGVVIIASLFEKRSAGLYHNTAAIIDSSGKLLGKYRKMHIPDDPLPRKVLLRQAISDFSAPTAQGKIGVCVCWDQYPKRRDSLRFVERRFYFIQPPSAGIRRKKRNSVRPNILPGKRFSAATRSRMVVTSRPQIASAMKRPQVARELSFGGKASLRRRAAKLSRKVQWTEKKL